jgi:hypothetical protein
MNLGAVTTTNVPQHWINGGVQVLPGVNPVVSAPFLVMPTPVPVAAKPEVEKPKAKAKKKGLSQKSDRW